MLDTRKYLLKTLELAEIALEKGTYPVGSVIIDTNGEILAEAYNHTFLDFDPTAHAEILCMRKAGKTIMKSYNTEPTYLFTSAEPCVGCGFFVRYTNIQTVVWALNDPYKGSGELLKGKDLLFEEFKNIEFVSEPLSDLKERSRKMYFEYFTNKGNTKVANYFK